MPRCGACLRLGARTGGRRDASDAHADDARRGRPAAGRGRGRPRDTACPGSLLASRCQQHGPNAKKPPAPPQPELELVLEAGWDGAGGAGRVLCNRCSAQIYLDATARRHAQSGCRAQALPML